MTDDDLVWVRCELDRLSPRHGLYRSGDVAQVPRSEAKRFGRFAVIVDSPESLRPGVWVDADPS